MKPRSVSVPVTLNWRWLGPRVSSFVMIMGALAMLSLNRVNPALVERVQSATGDFLAPTISFLRQPMTTVHTAIEELSHASTIFTENAELREQNRKLIAWRDTALRLEAENGSLRSQLHVAPDPGNRQMMVRVIGDPAGGFVQSLMLAAGSDAGIAKGQPAVTAVGAAGSQDNGALVGRVIQTGERSSRLLLLTDVNSRVPVLLEQSRLHAILGGDDTDRPQLMFLPPGASISVGERVITSGNDQMLPPGIAVGVVVGTGAGGIKVAPLADLSRLDFVTILNYEGVEPLAAPEAPPEKTRGKK